MENRETEKPEKLWRVDGFAESLEVTEAGVRKWILEREISCIKIGRNIRIPDSERRRLLSEGLRPRKEAR